MRKRAGKEEVADGDDELKISADAATAGFRGGHRLLPVAGLVSGLKKEALLRARFTKCIPRGLKPTWILLGSRRD
jgi:hypothetical protein